MFYYFFYCFQCFEDARYFIHVFFFLVSRLVSFWNFILKTKKRNLMIRKWNQIIYFFTKKYMGGNRDGEGRHPSKVMPSNNKRAGRNDFIWYLSDYNEIQQEKEIE
jgi:hypothetical protein